jgi:hypothetical protein
LRRIGWRKIVRRQRRWTSADTTPAGKLVRSTRQQWAIVAIIELARGDGKNPEVPTRLKEDYLQAIREPAELGAAEIWHTKEPDTVQAILGGIPIAKSLRTHERSSFKRLRFERSEASFRFEPCFTRWRNE